MTPRGPSPGGGSGRFAAPIIRLAATWAFALVLAAPDAWAQAPPAWPQTASDLKADPAVRFGVLANGLRYAVMHNATPAGQTSIRLRIGSGSLQESDDQQGLAHVLEHMAFKGSTHVPEGEMIKILERKGLAFGPDTNAETEWTQTVYRLDLPRSGPEDLDTGLMLMRETAGELTLSDAALASERGVVLSEERLRDTPAYRGQKAQIELLAEGQLAARRFPIGTVDVIKSAPASRVRDFYQANYRPSRATLIVVGDVNPSVVEGEIKAKFSNWAAKGPETPEPDLGQVRKRGLTVKLAVVPGAATETQIAWTRPYDASPDTSAKRRRDTVEDLALAVLNRRLAALARGEAPPFLTAQSGFENLFHSVKIAIVEASSKPDAWRDALAAVDAETRRLVQYGISQSELEREIHEMRAGLVSAATGAATRPTPELASGLVDSVDDSEVFTAPAEDLALFDAAVKGLTAQEATASARAIFAGSGPLVLLTTPAAVDGGRAAVEAAYAKAKAAPVAAPAAPTALTWPYQAFGPPGRVISRQTLGDVGATLVRFANGVALTVKPTAFRKDQILVGVQIDSGRAGLPSDHAANLWMASAFTAGGFKALSLEDSQRVLAGKIYEANFSVGDGAFELRGATRPADLPTQIQVLAAYVADPGFRSEAFERVRSSYAAALPQLAATPEGVLQRDFAALTHGDDPRWTFPTAEVLAAAKPADLRALLADALAHGSLEVTIVGDVSVDEAIRQTASTFGALPLRPTPGRPGRLAAPRAPAPTLEPVLRRATGRPDQAAAVVAWPLTDFYADLAGARVVMLTGEVLGNRVLDQVRVKEGATYSPETEATLSETFPGYGLAFSLVEMPPDKIPGFFADVSRITREMADVGITADELERARNPRIASIRKAQLTNEYWLARLAGVHADPRRLDIIRTTLPDYAKVTPAEIQSAARTWFRDDKAWKLIVKAQPSTAP